MTTTAKRYRLKELHAQFLSEFERNARDNAMGILLQIGKEAIGVQVVEDSEFPTVNGEVRAQYWQALYERVRNSPTLACKVLENWSRDKSAA